MSAECHFYILNRDDPYDSHALYVRSGGRSHLTLEEPPLVGDLISLAGETVDLTVPEDEDGERPYTDIVGVWRVVARCWSPAQYGSVSWSSGDRQPNPVWLDVTLEPSDGIFSASHYNSTQASD